MDKAQIGKELATHHSNFVEKLRSLSDSDFQRKPGKKWTAGQQLEHILKSVRPVDKAFGLPPIALKLKFGLSDKPSMSYDTLVENYLKVLEDNKDYVLPERFAPEEIPLSARGKKLTELGHLIQNLGKNVSKASENYLETHILPHPVMGKLTLREILYFTIYHVQHHDRQILENLSHAN